MDDWGDLISALFDLLSDLLDAFAQRKDDGDA